MRLPFQNDKPSYESRSRSASWRHSPILGLRCSHGLGAPTLLVAPTLCHLLPPCASHSVPCSHKALHGHHQCPFDNISIYFTYFEWFFSLTIFYKITRQSSIVVQQIGCDENRMRWNRRICSRRGERLPCWTVRMERRVHGSTSRSQSHTTTSHTHTSLENIDKGEKEEKICIIRSSNTYIRLPCLKRRGVNF